MQTPRSIKFGTFCEEVFRDQIKSIEDANAFFTKPRRSKFKKFPKKIKVTLRQIQRRNTANNVRIGKKMNHLVFRFKSVVESKSKTHNPFIFLSKKREFDEALSIFVKLAAAREPKFKKIESMSLESDKCKKFFEALEKSSSKYNDILSALDKI